MAADISTGSPVLRHVFIRNQVALGNDILTGHHNFVDHTNMAATVGRGDRPMRERAETVMDGRAGRPCSNT
jgi:hypothetical protein